VVSILQKYFANPNFAANLTLIKSHFGFLSNIITSLETKNISLFDTIKMTSFASDNL